jgi:hypothetical protein
LLSLWRIRRVVELDCALAPRCPAGTRAKNIWTPEPESHGYAPSTINQRLAAIKKLAREAAANGLLDSAVAAGIDQVPGVKQQGTRASNWLTKAQAESLINAPDPQRSRASATVAMLALLVGCGLRRGESCGAYRRAHPAARRPLGDCRSARQARPPAHHRRPRLGQTSCRSVVPVGQRYRRADPALAQPPRPDHRRISVSAGCPRCGRVLWRAVGAPVYGRTTSAEPAPSCAAAGAGNWSRSN